MVSPAFPGLFFTFAAAVLLIFVSVSAPTWRDIYFLSASNGQGTIRYGVFGYCTASGACSKTSLGYQLSTAAIGGNFVELGTTLHNFTYVLILHPIAAGLAGIAFLFGLLGACLASRACTIFMTIIAFLALLVTLVAVGIDLALWIIMRRLLNDNGFNAMLGNANWLTIGALAALILGTCTAACGSCGRFATGRMGGEKY